MNITETIVSCGRCGKEHTLIGSAQDNVMTKCDCGTFLIPLDRNGFVDVSALDECRRWTGDALERLRES